MIDRTLVSRFVSPFITAGIGWLAAKGFNIDVNLDALTEVVTWLFFGGILAINGVTHKLIDRKVNPADTAKPTS